MKYFRLYVKFPDKKKYSPVDWKNGKPVINLIYATIFNEIEVKQAFIEATRMNKNVNFQIREISEGEF